MKYIVKIFPFVISGIFIYALGNIIWIIKSYNDILTSTPLWMIIAVTAAEYGALILICVIIYLIILKRRKNKK